MSFIASFLPLTPRLFTFLFTILSSFLAGEQREKKRKDSKAKAGVKRVEQSSSSFLV